MPVREVEGQSGCYQWGESGKIYCGAGAKEKAERQGRAIYSTGWREAEMIEGEKYYVPKGLELIDNYYLEEKETGKVRMIKSKWEFKYSNNEGEEQKVIFYTSIEPFRLGYKENYINSERLHNEYKREGKFDPVLDYYTERFALPFASKIAMLMLITEYYVFFEMGVLVKGSYGGNRNTLLFYTQDNFLPNNYDYLKYVFDNKTKRGRWGQTKKRPTFNGGLILSKKYNPVNIETMVGENNTTKHSNIFKMIEFYTNIGPAPMALYNKDKLLKFIREESNIEFYYNILKKRGWKDYKKIEVPQYPAYKMMLLNRISKAETFEAEGDKKPYSVIVSRSSKPEKKLMAVFSDKEGNKIKTTHFGQRGASDYTKHGDKERMERYLERHGGGTTTSTKEDWKDPTTAGSLSRWILWNKPSLSGSFADYKRRFGLKGTMKVSKSAEEFESESDDSFAICGRKKQHGIRNVFDNVKKMRKCKTTDNTNYYEIDYTYYTEMADGMTDNNYKNKALLCDTCVETYKPFIGTVIPNKYDPNRTFVINDIKLIGGNEDYLKDEIQKKKGDLDDYVVLAMGRQGKKLHLGKVHSIDHLGKPVYWSCGVENKYGMAWQQMVREVPKAEMENITCKKCLKTINSINDRIEQLENELKSYGAETIEELTHSSVIEGYQPFKYSVVTNAEENETAISLDDFRDGLYHLFMKDKITESDMIGWSNDYEAYLKGLKSTKPPFSAEFNALTSAQKSLNEWTDQKWRTKSGKPSTQGKDATGERYLPEKAIKALSDKEYKRTSAKKKRDTKAGKQFSNQPDDIEKKVKKYRSETFEAIEGKGSKARFTDMPDPKVYRDPKLRQKARNTLLKGDKGGKKGQWSARKAQMSATKYRTLYENKYGEGKNPYF